MEGFHVIIGLNMVTVSDSLILPLPFAAFFTLPSVIVTDVIYSVPTQEKIRLVWNYGIELICHRLFFNTGENF